MRPTPPRSRALKGAGGPQRGCRGERGGVRGVGCAWAGASTGETHPSRHPPHRPAGALAARPALKPAPPAPFAPSSRSRLCRQRAGGESGAGGERVWAVRRERGGHTPAGPGRFVSSSLPTPPSLPSQPFGGAPQTPVPRKALRAPCRTGVSHGGRRLRRLQLRRALLKRRTAALASCFSAAPRAVMPLWSMDFGELVRRGRGGGLCMSRSTMPACALSTWGAIGSSNLCPTRARISATPLFLAGAHWRPARHACGPCLMERHKCLKPV